VPQPNHHKYFAVPLEDACTAQSFRQRFDVNDIATGRVQRLRWPIDDDLIAFSEALVAAARKCCGGREKL
jgi:hypothetical protein